MSAWPAFRRRRLVVEPGYQYRFVAMQVAQIGVILGLVGWFALTHVHNIQDMSQRLLGMNAESKQLQAVLADSARQFYTWSLVLGAATVVLLILCGLSASHKLAGPVYKLRVYFNRIAEGDNSSLIAFRRNDRLEQFSTAINAAMIAERARRKEIVDCLESIDSSAQQLEHVTSADKVKELLDSMHKQASSAKGVRAAKSVFQSEVAMIFFC